MVYLLRDDGGEKGSPTPQPSPLHLSRRNDETGDIAWGLGVQSDKLFASSMTREEKGFSGTHKVFDAQLERTACTLRLSEAGIVILNVVTNECWFNFLVRVVRSAFRRVR